MTPDPTTLIATYVASHPEAREHFAAVLPARDPWVVHAAEIRALLSMTPGGQQDHRSGMHDDKPHTVDLAAYLREHFGRAGKVWTGGELLSYFNRNFRVWAEDHWQALADHINAETSHG